MAVIGTWNVENLFRPGGEFGPPDQQAYERKLAALAATIQGTGVDVLAVQEIGEPGALDDLAALLPGEWHTALSDHFGPSHPIRVGFLSRLPLTVVGSAALHQPPLAPVQSDDAGAREMWMSRGALAARVEPVPGEQLTLVSVHLKSKLLSFPPNPDGTPRFNARNEGERARYAAYSLFRRAAEAVTVRGLVDSLLDNLGRTRALAVLGDLNDEPLAATTQILNGPPGSELGTPGADAPDRGDAARLWNLAELIPPEERHTRTYRGRGELIDHILVSHAMLAKVKEVRVPGTVALPTVTDNPVERRAASGSDHAPVLATLTTG
jgi:endonuclease/exonuclease/phosphatase family metal-dependent hydrolase